MELFIDFLIILNIFRVYQRLVSRAWNRDGEREGMRDQAHQ